MSGPQSCCSPEGQTTTTFKMKQHFYKALQHSYKTQPSCKQTNIKEATTMFSKRLLLLWVVLKCFVKCCDLAQSLLHIDSLWSSCVIVLKELGLEVQTWLHSLRSHACGSLSVYLARHSLLCSLKWREKGRHEKVIRQRHRSFLFTPVKNVLLM